jgi:uncharacterized protein YndB with AHSA1/START domain
MTNFTGMDQDEYGRLERLEGRYQLRFQRRLPHPPDKVWRAITEPQHLAAWFPAQIVGERASGAPLRFVFEEHDGTSVDGQMLTFDPPRLMELRWGEEILRVELLPDGAGTLLTFTDVFDELGKAARDAAGWHACLDLLAYDLSGQPAPWSSADRWAQVHPVYVEGFGPEAGTIGPPEEWQRAHGSAND